MDKIITVVQNLEMGGIQRLSLDETYYLSREGFSNKLVLLENISNLSKNNFFEREKDLIKKYNVFISEAGESRLEQFSYFKLLMKSEGYNLKFISHSLRATVIIRLAKICTRTDAKICTTIHQLPSLSAFRQRIKRFFYSLFSDFLFAYSAAVKNDWDYRINSNMLSKLLFKNQQISLVRNGVFLDRMPNRFENKKISQLNEPRLIFLGRPTSWKGIDTVIKLAEQRELSNASILFMIPHDNLEFLKDLPKNILERVSVRVGRSFSDYKPQLGDVHLYPTNYGSRAIYTESISINCLEMASVGVPSIVTKGGLNTWPELQNDPIFTEVDWNNLKETSLKILHISKYSFPEIEIKRYQKIIDIDNHVGNVLQHFNIKL